MMIRRQLDKYKLNKFYGISLALTSFIFLVLLTFAYRDASMQLVFMFFFTLIGLPLSTYLLIKRNTYFQIFQKEDDDAMDVVGKFSI